MKGTSKLILGTVQFGLKYGINNLQGKPDKEEVFEILSYAYENGIRYLDTSELYGNAHELIGEFHKINPSNKFQVITKFPHDFEDNLENKIDTYLTQLNVDYLNAILFHSFESYKKHKEQLKNIIKHKNKSFKNIGISIYSNEQMDEVIDDINIDIIQLPFNLFDNLNLRGELLIKAKEKNKKMFKRHVVVENNWYVKS
jgi:aryl-alcohol dehydrogenase-like predicted oxidoreductase